MICVELDEFLHDAVASLAGPVLTNVQLLRMRR
jgi:hypothetical protein